MILIWFSRILSLLRAQGVLLKIYTPKKTWHQNFLHKNLEDLLNTSILKYYKLLTLYNCLLYQHFWGNSLIADKKFEWIIFWSINKNCAWRCVNPKNMYKKYMIDLLSEKYGGYNYSDQKKVGHRSCIMRVPPLGLTATYLQWQPFYNGQ